MILLAALALLAQDPVERLIDQLESPDVADRERAEKDLIAIGEPALPALKSAMKNGSLEARERATAAYHAVLWNSWVPPKDLSAEVRTALQVPRAQAWTDAEDSPLYALLEAFQGPIGTTPIVSHGLPGAGRGSTPWEYLDTRGFADAYTVRARSRDERWKYWRAKVDGRVVCATAPVFDDLPRFLLLSGSFDLSRARWDEKTGRIAALEKHANPWRTLRLEKREEVRSDAKIAAVLFTFGWDSEKPRADLRYVFLADRFLIYCVAYR